MHEINKLKDRGDGMKAYRVTIRMVDVEPAVWREVMIPYGAMFQRLHLYLTGCADEFRESLPPMGEPRPSAGRTPANRKLAPSSG